MWRLDGHTEQGLCYLQDVALPTVAHNARGSKNGSAFTCAIADARRAMSKARAALGFSTKETKGDILGNTP
jgi:hypothetical protein